MTATTDNRELRALVQKWRAESTRRDEAAFEMENDDPDDAGWNHGVSAGMDECADELEALLTRTEADEAATVGAEYEVVDLQAAFPACAVVPCAPVGTKLYTHPQDASAKDRERLDWLESQAEAYGFENEHHGNRWVIEGPFRNLRIAIDEALAALPSPPKGEK